MSGIIAHRIDPHDMRNVLWTFGHSPLCLASGTRRGIVGEDKVVADIGYSMLEVTQMYMHLASAHAKIQHQRFSPVDRLGIRRRRR